MKQIMSLPGIRSLRRRMIALFGSRTIVHLQVKFDIAPYTPREFLRISWGPMDRVIFVWGKDVLCQFTNGDLPRNTLREALPRLVEESPHRYRRVDGVGVVRTAGHTVIIEYHDVPRGGLDRCIELIEKEKPKIGETPTVQGTDPSVPSPARIVDSQRGTDDRRGFQNGVVNGGFILREMD